MSETTTRNPRKCHAHSSRTGEPCQRWAMKGQRVCATHGGRAPAAKRSARERLEALVEPAIEALALAIRSGNTRDIITAAKAVLDRSGFPRATRLEIEQAEQAIGQSHATQIADVVRGTLADVGIEFDTRVVEALRSNLLRVSEGRPYRRELQAHVEDATDDVHDAEVLP